MSFDFSWMAWTWPTVIFFVVIACLLLGMGVWEYARPGGAPKVGLLRFETTRGDRLLSRCWAAPSSIWAGWGLWMPACGGRRGCR